MDNLRLEQLALTDFRLHQSLTLEFAPQTTLIIGPNASGKTAIIEAIYMAGTGGSFRAGKIEEMIRFDQELARVNLEIRNDGHFRHPSVSAEGSESQDRMVEREKDSKTNLDILEVLLTRGVVQGRKTQYRLFSINEVKKRKKDFIGRFQPVLFRPEDMRLVEGSPTRRRSFLDQVLSPLFYEYRVSLKTYENTLKRRNRLLWAVREGEQSPRVLQFWNLSLIKNGTLIQDYRKRFLESFDKINSPFDYQVEYLPKVISESRLARYLEREIASGHSLIGPHKDDFRVLFYRQDQTLVDKSMLLDVATYGSRGQQRLAVLWLKLGQGAYLESNTDQSTIWLLDDILSELDKNSRQLVLELIKNKQAIITSASKKVVDLVSAEKIIQL